MDWFYILATGVLILIGYVMGSRHGVSKFVESKTIGHLRVDRSDEDGPLVFMEVDPGFRDFTDMDVVILKVKHEDFIPRK